MVSISSATTAPYVPFTAARKAARTTEEVAQIDEAEAWRASVEKNNAAITNGTAIVINNGDGIRVDISKYTFPKVRSITNPIDSLREQFVENHDVLAGSVEQIGSDRLRDVISKLAEDIGANAFKGQNFFGARNGELTNSADVFLGWLKDKEASLTPGNLISKTA